MPPDMVDVNVHPTKLEVRFQDGGRLYSQLLATLRSKFLTTDLTTRAQAAAGAARIPAAGTTRRRRPSCGRSWSIGPRARWPPGSSPAEPAAAPEAAGRRTLGPQRAAEAMLVPAASTLPRAPPLELTRLDLLRPASSRRQSARRGRQSAEAFVRRGPGRVPARHLRRWEHASVRPPQALQIHNRYLVTETQEGVTIIDQHALHERILYEQLRQRIDAGALETQNLLVPEPVDLSPAEAAIALEHRDVLGQLGLRIEPFGGDTVLVTGFPAMLANMNPGEILRALLERLVSGGGQPDRRDLLDDMLHTVACKAAIKAGDRLTAVEIAALLEQRHMVDDSHHCPHGRPTELVFTREELDKQFKRI